MMERLIEMSLMNLYNTRMIHLTLILFHLPLVFILKNQLVRNIHILCLFRKLLHNILIQDMQIEYIVYLS